ncbi:MAG: flagellar hook-length control protein FliK [Gallionellaceae bacterium]|jgi:flagellar hook-length control protein FliK
MSNLPITINAPQAAAKAPQNSASSENNAAPEKPFGEVLAKQVAKKSNPEESGKEKNSAETSDAEKAGADASLSGKKIGKKTADEIFEQIKSSSDAAQALPDALSSLPADLLASMLPQNLNKSALDAANLSKQSQTRTELTAAEQVAEQVSEQPGAGKNAPGVDQKDQSKQGVEFAARLEASNASAAGKFAAAEEKLAAIASAAKPVETPMPISQTALTSLTPANVFPAQVTINTPVTHDKWGEEFNQKITWLASSKEQSAELHLNPPQLGPMDVVIKVSGDQATALFTSAHAVVREAIEQALPKLREMMAESGIMLSNASVSDQTPRDQQSNAENRSGNARIGSGGSKTAEESANMSMRASPISRHNGIVDTFA